MARPMPKAVLVLSGHDPTGGAGLVADSEAIAACQGWALSIPTALTVQNGHDVDQLLPVSSVHIEAAVAALGDWPVKAIKVGLLSDQASLEAVVRVLQGYPGVPVVIDPVLKAGGGAELSTPGLMDAFVDKLLPLASLVTPNRLELKRLSRSLGVEGSDRERVDALLSQGCQAVLVTATDDPLASVPDQGGVEHVLYQTKAQQHWQWPRLPGQFHGSGCTLAASIAARLAQGESLAEACRQGQHFTWHSLSQGYHPASGQAMPNRWIDHTF